MAGAEPAIPIERHADQHQRDRFEKQKKQGRQRICGMRAEIVRHEIGIAAICHDRDLYRVVGDGILFGRVDGELRVFHALGLAESSFGDEIGRSDRQRVEQRANYIADQPQRQQLACRHAQEQHGDKPGRRIEDEDIPAPDEEEMHEAEHQQDRQSPGLQTPPFAARPRALHE